MADKYGHAVSEYHYAMSTAKGMKDAETEKNVKAGKTAVKVVFVAIIAAIVMSFTAGCNNGNLIDKIVTDRGHCPAESWGGHCDN